MGFSNCCTTTVISQEFPPVWTLVEGLWRDKRVESGCGSDPTRKVPSVSDRSREEATQSGMQRILLVEDSNSDVFLIREALRTASVSAEIQVVSDGEKAIRFFDELDADEQAPCPILILLDLNLPKRTGAEVLQHIRKSRRCANALVAIVTSSGSDRDRRDASRFGADRYFQKPSSYDEYIDIGKMVRDLLAGRQQ